MHKICLILATTIQLGKKYSINVSNELNFNKIKLFQKILKLIFVYLEIKKWGDV